MTEGQDDPRPGQHSARPPGGWPGRRPGGAWLRLWPLALLLAGGVLAYALGLGRYLSLGALAEYREALAVFVETRPLQAVLIYVAAYAFCTACLVPGTILTLAGGFLFGRWLGAGLAVTAATLGGSLLFLIVRSALEPLVHRQIGPLVERLRPALEQDGFWYLLSLRFMPVVPFWLGNVAPAMVGMRLPVFAAATALGILPATLVYAWIGAGLAEIFARGGSPDLSAVLSPLVGLPFLVLAGLGLLTGWWRARRGGDGNAATGEGEERPAGRRRRRVRLRGRGSRP
ncbi:putative membrane spanning protein [Roseomonas mucosa]|uniref:TVP38/TMEM64 family membrane protein n=1 Tax=Roseomonas mucosa TaxID=207340 RepID=A0A1S8D608_9PROT|nr:MULTISPECIES: TVP38/TMEM64 family protein [Roseomonas]MBS5902748.1 TVP38/TMEM64 family protein [Acetobacteraceae bacterium]ATR22455.1 TVP38/TMEM64 family protein [Roseomonas sp. FDAARGOS_362]AWV24567.1 putative membrane spanning protein [Roseomonas mucosa]MCG7352809.1 TVP38/TMEM64 family protein [Roseomonas mucosa]MCG7358685.1 TVP38/TMEM64 family protein [Roseomonas mucosa]